MRILPSRLYTIRLYQPKKTNEITMNGTVITKEELQMALEDIMRKKGMARNENHVIDVPPAVGSDPAVVISNNENAVCEGARNDASNVVNDEASGSTAIDENNEEVEFGEIMELNEREDEVVAETAPSNSQQINESTIIGGSIINNRLQPTVVNNDSRRRMRKQIYDRFDIKQVHCIICSKRFMSFDNIVICSEQCSKVLNLLG